MSHLMMMMMMMAPGAGALNSAWCPLDRAVKGRCRAIMPVRALITARLRMG
jgi:hypothetical protein